MKTLKKYQFEINFRIGANVNVVAEDEESAMEKLQEYIDNYNLSIEEYTNNTIGLEANDDYIDEIGEYEVEVEDLHQYDEVRDIQISKGYCEEIDEFEYEEEENE